MIIKKQLIAITLSMTCTFFSSQGCAASQSTTEGATETIPQPVSSGQGDPVVFVHGALSDQRAWTDVTEVLAKHVDKQLINYTQRYFGPHEKPVGKPEDFQRETHVNDLIRLIESLESGPAILVTWSYGGEIGLHAQKQRPDLIRAAIHFEPILFPLLNQIPGGTSARQKNVQDIVLPARSQAIAGDLNAAAFKFIEGVFSMTSEEVAGARSPWPEMWRANSGTIPAYGAMQSLPLVCRDLSDISAPTLILSGSKTRTEYAMMAEEISRCLQNAIAITVKGHGHELPYANPRKLAEMVASFLKMLE